MTCASTRGKSEPKVRREAGLLTVVGLSHAENVANRATRGVADNYQPTCEQTKADDSAFTVVLAQVFDLDRHSLENQFGVLEIQTTLSECTSTFDRIVGDAHPVIVSTLIVASNRGDRPLKRRAVPTSLVKPNV